MAFETPISFEEARRALEVRGILPTVLSSAELDALAAPIRERAFFSARVANYSFLERARDLVLRLVDPGLDPDGEAIGPGESVGLPTARLRLKEFLRGIGYNPTEEGVEPGSIQDLSSARRLNLILETNHRMADGYGQWEGGQDPVILDAFPALELYRQEAREEPRDWPSRWRANGGQFYGGGRMVALKTDDIWTRISRFGLPYPPFDYNSGMWTREIDRDQAEEWGLLTRSTVLQPQSRNFNEDMNVYTETAETPLEQALLRTLREDE